MMVNCEARVPRASVIALRGVSKAYHSSAGQVPIFQSLDLEFAEGEFTAIMGPSGSGKTTLLNLLGGIDRVDGGSICFRGQEIANLSEGGFTKWRARHAGFIFQFYNLMAGLSAAQNVALPLMLHKMPRSERKRRVDAALDLVGLRDRAGHLPSRLSGGQQQRVAIARAIVADPDLILADEPTGDLDRETADQVLTIMRMLCSHLGKTIIMVTHDEKAALAAGRVLHLDKGALVDTRVSA